MKKAIPFSVRELDFREKEAIVTDFKTISG